MFIKLYKRDVGINPKPFFFPHFIKRVCLICLMQSHRNKKIHPRSSGPALKPKEFCIIQWSSGSLLLPVIFNIWYIWSPDWWLWSWVSRLSLSYRFIDIFSFFFQILLCTNLKEWSLLQQNRNVLARSDQDRQRGISPVPGKWRIPQNHRGWCREPQGGTAQSHHLQNPSQPRGSPPHG